MLWGTEPHRPPLPPCPTSVLRLQRVINQSHVVLSQQPCRLHCRKGDVGAAWGGAAVESGDGFWSQPVLWGALCRWPLLMFCCCPESLGGEGCL